MPSKDQSGWMEKPPADPKKVKQMPRYQMKPPGSMNVMKAPRKLVPKPPLKKKP